MMYLYDQNELNFSRNGRTIQDAFNAKVVHYLNSEYTLTFSVLMNDEIAKDLEINKIVFAENQPFRITTIQPSLKEFKVYARHVFFDLLDYQVENVNVNSVTGQTVMNAIFSSNDTNFTYTSDITKRSTMNDSKKNIVEMLARAIERFEGELKRDKFSVALNNKIGKDTNYVVYPNKNISSSVKETDISSVCTRVIVEYGEYEDIKQVIVVSENVDLYPQTKTKRYQNLDLKTEADAIAWGKGKFQGINRIDVPKVSIEIDLSLDRELSGLEIGDTLICKIPTLKLDERIQIIGYEFDPNTNLRTKIFAGFKAKGLSGTINNSVVEAIRPEISDIDDKLQQQINEANEAIQKEYEERVESVNDAIAKAEADAEVMKEALQTEISQAVTDWNTEFDEAKTQIDNSIGNVEKILGGKIEANTSEITVAKNKISMVVADGSTASAVQLTPNALTAIAKDINLKGNVTFNSLVEGDGTNTQILGGKIKTNSISANKLIVGNSQSLVRLTKGEGTPNTDIVAYHPYWGLTFKDEGLPVCSLTPHFRDGAISTEQLGWANKEIKLRITHNIFYGPYVPFYFQIYCFDDNGAVTLSAQTEQINPSHNVNSIQNHVIDLGVIDQNKHRYVYIRLLRPTTESFSEYGVNTLTITEMNAGELIVDGAIKANHIVSGSAELGAVTSKVLSTEALNAAWANIGNAFINKLTSDDALFQRLTAKTAWITSANIVSLEASRIKGGTLQSTNGLLSWNLDNSYLRFSGASNAMEYVLGGNSVGIRFGDLYSKVLSKTVPTVSLYANAGVDTANIRIDLISQEQQINIRGDRISFYDHDASVQGWHLNTVGATNRWDQSLTPFGNGYNELGQSDRYFYAVRATNMIDTLSLFSMPTTFSEQQSFTDISALDVIDKCQVREFLEGDGFTNTIDLERDTPENAKIGVDFTYLRRLKTSDASLLFTEQGEMTLNTEIAILWKAVQELSEQNKMLQEQINLLK